MDDENAKNGAPAPSSDEVFASDIHDFHALLKSGDREGLIAALENPELYRLACDDERYLRIAMQGIAVLAWTEPAMASEFLVRFDSERARQDPTSSARRAARALMAALEWRQLEAEPESPFARAEVLRDFLRLYPALADEGAHATKLHADLRERPERYASLLESLCKSAQVLPRWIFNMPSESVEEPAVLGVDEEDRAPELTDEQLSAMAGTVAELRVSLRSKVHHYAVWLAATALVIVLPSALGALFGLLLLGASFTLGERRAYSQVVRPRLIRLAIEHGVGAKQVVRSIYGRRVDAGKVGNFDIKIENDHALDLLAALSMALGSPLGAEASASKTS